MTLLLRTYVGGGVLLALLAIPLWLRRVPRNPIYGFRVPQTFADPVLWYEVNAQAGKWLFVAGVATLVAATTLYFVPGIGPDAYALACMAVVVPLLIVALAQGIMRLQQLRP